MYVMYVHVMYVHVMYVHVSKKSFKFIINYSTLYFSAYYGLRDLAS